MPDKQTTLTKALVLRALLLMGIGFAVTAIASLM